MLTTGNLGCSTHAPHTLELSQIGDYSVLEDSRAFHTLSGEAFSIVTEPFDAPATVPDSTVESEVEDTGRCLEVSRGGTLSSLGLSPILLAELVLQCSTNWSPTDSTIIVRKMLFDFMTRWHEYI